MLGKAKEGFQGKGCWRRWGEGLLGRERSWRKTMGLKAEIKSKGAVTLIVPSFLMAPKPIHCWVKPGGDS